MGWLILIVVLVCVGGFLFYASYSIRSGVYVKALCKGETDKRVVCLTFDDGPDPKHTPQVLDVLKKYQAPAAFFCVGEKVLENQELFKRMVKEGYYIGNHTHKHSWTFPFLSFKKMYDEILKGEDALYTYADPLSAFRPPFGVTNPTIARVTDELGYTIIGWSIRSFDTRRESEDRVFRRIIRQIEPGAVILLHDRLPGCASLVARLLEYLKTIDYEVIPLDTMFYLPRPFEKEYDNE